VGGYGEIQDEVHFGFDTHYLGTIRTLNLGHINPVEDVHNLGIFLLVDDLEHFVAFHSGIVHGILTFPGDFHFDTSGNRGMEAFDEEEEEFGHIVLSPSGENFLVFDFG